MACILLEACTILVSHIDLDAAVKAGESGKDSRTVQRIRKNQDIRNEKQICLGAIKGGGSVWEC